VGATNVGATNVGRSGGLRSVSLELRILDRKNTVLLKNKGLTPNTFQISLTNYTKINMWYKTAFYFLYMPQTLHYRWCISSS